MYAKIATLGAMQLSSRKVTDRGSGTDRPNIKCHQISFEILAFLFIETNAFMAKDEKRPTRTEQVNLSFMKTLMSQCQKSILCWSIRNFFVRSGVYKV